MTPTGLAMTAWGAAAEHVERVFKTSGADQTGDRTWHIAQLQVPPGTVEEELSFFEGLHSRRVRKRDASKIHHNLSRMSSPNKGKQFGSDLGGGEQIQLAAHADFDFQMDRRC